MCVLGRVGGLAVLCAVSAAVVAGQGPPAQTPDPTPQFKAGVELVEVYATVVDAGGKPVPGLTAGRFAVLENGEPRPIEAFAAGEFPLAVALAVDRSWSMAGPPLQTAKRGGRALLSALRDEDQATVVSISGVVERLTPLSSDRQGQVAAVDRLDPWSTTALHDAIVSAIDLVEPATGRTALVLLSDGADRYSRASAADVLERARRSSVLLYPIAVGPRRPPLFVELAAVSGGRSFQAASGDEATHIVRTIVEELRQQYLLGYAPSPRGMRGEWRRIEVRVDVPGTRVRAREGYRVP